MFCFCVFIFYSCLLFYTITSIYLMRFFCLFFFPQKIIAPAKAPAKKKPEISSGSATVVRSKGGKAGAKAATQNIEKELSDEDVDEIISGMLNANIVGEIASANWKSR